MGKSIFLAAVLMFLGSMAFAGHAISLEPEVAPAKAVEPAAAPPSPVSEPAAVAPVAEPALPAVAPTPAAQPAQVNVTFPSEHDLYLVPAATREVCTTREWGFGEIQTDCRTTPIRVRAEDPALRGLCVTRYGRRTCH
jgi:hypothetical protein